MAVSPRRVPLSASRSLGVPRPVPQPAVAPGPHHLLVARPGGYPQVRVKELGPMPRQHLDHLLADLVVVVIVVPVAHGVAAGHTREWRHRMVRRHDHVRPQHAAFPHTCARPDLHAVAHQATLQTCTIPDLDPVVEVAPVQDGPGPDDAVLPHHTP